MRLLTVSFTTFLLLFASQAMSHSEEAPSQARPIAIAIHGGAETIQRENLSREREHAIRTALDRAGNLAAGTSTGGTANKRWGRVGDSPIIGAGTYADNRSCAVSATGHGEYFIRHVVAYNICARMLHGNESLADSADTVVNKLLADEGGDGGVIALDANGNIAMPFNTSGMYRASVDRDGNVSVKIYRDD